MCGAEGFGRLVQQTDIMSCTDFRDSSEVRGLAVEGDRDAGLRPTSFLVQSFEHALAVDPNDGPARFNFAMSLVQGNYYAAAARELETYLQSNPDSAQAHFEAGKLYAEKLHDVARANVHYKRVIGLQPGHPQAVAIRYWLIRNRAN